MKTDWPLKISQIVGLLVDDLYDVILEGGTMPVRYSEDSAGPSTRRAAAEEHYEDISTTGAAADLAAELGVDLSEVEGTGKDGRITKADVEKAGG